METWAIVTIVLVSNFTTAVAMYFTTRQQVSHSDRRFEKELERAQQKETRDRRREVRGQPLLKLKSELARMAFNQEELVRAAHMQHTRVGFTEEEAREILKKAIDNFNTYMRGGQWSQTLFMVDDIELINKVEEILKAYNASYVDAIHYTEVKARELGEAMKVFEKNKVRIVETQAIINKRLEEL